MKILWMLLFFIGVVFLAHFTHAVENLSTDTGELNLSQFVTYGVYRLQIGESLPFNETQIVLVDVSEEAVFFRVQPGDGLVIIQKNQTFEYAGGRLRIDSLDPTGVTVVFGPPLPTLSPQASTPVSTPFSLPQVYSSPPSLELGVLVKQVTTEPSEFSACASLDPVLVRGERNQTTEQTPQGLRTTVSILLWNLGPAVLENFWLTERKPVAPGVSFMPEPTRLTQDKVSWKFDRLNVNQTVLISYYFDGQLPLVQSPPEISSQQKRSMSLTETFEWLFVAVLFLLAAAWWISKKYYSKKTQQL